MKEVGLGRETDLKSIEFNDGDVNRLGRLELERGVEAEFVEADDGVAGVGRHGNSFSLSRWPDSQASALRLDSFDEGHVEAIELNARVESPFKGCDNAGSEERFGTANSDGDGDSEG